MKTPTILMTALLAGASSTWAQEKPAPAPPVSISGAVSSGTQQVDNDTNSSKLTEYRDLRDGFFAPQIRFNLFNARSGDFLGLHATNVSREDQAITASFGRMKVWDVQVQWTEVPHNFGNAAVTPYILHAPGLLEVPATIPITFKKLATGAPDTAGVLASDDLIAAYQATFLRPTDLHLNSDFGRAAFTYAGFGVAYDTIRKNGLKPAYGPIGDRPPRTLNIQLTEPVDYRTTEVTLSAERTWKQYLAQFEYLFSDFANDVDTLVWQNVYTTAAPDATYDVWDRAVSTYGRRPLPPDTRYHNLSFGLAGDLPLESRLSARVAYGRMEQNETLLPYSFNANILADPTLPRATADAEIVTTQFLADYVVNPTGAVNVRTWVRRFGMENNTPEAHWRYVTSDTSNLNGTVTFLNKRINPPYAADRTQAGADLTYRLPARSSFVAGYERESLSRDHREADTAEDRLTLALRTRAARWAHVRARYLFGDRRGDGYNGTFTREGYWYELAEAGTDNNNPKFTFDNHPDMRRYDVSDRRRNQFDVTVNLTPNDALALSGVVRYRSEDFDSGVRATQPLDAGVGEASATTPGQQLGLLENSRLLYSIDVFCTPAPRLTVNAFVGRDTGTSLQRGLEFNENNKANPSTIANAELGPWTRASSQWSADFDDETWTAGAGTTIELVPGRLTMSATYTASRANVDVEYAGFGVTNWDGTPFPPNHQFQFPAAPPTIREDLHVLDLRFDVPIAARTTLSFGYAFERYVLEDWQQDAPQSWVETLGGETLLRDTSRSYQWGNRLFNLGNPLAPEYTAHIGWTTLGVRF